ncbi:hypothetical protein AB0K09_03685 [Streptomyces sp. NPDC049577]|uniref:hypothetical protein n=1 Tax=Streptomyces sp. NPDC049577 TaxID=3155153 RepID=UPI00342A5B95
MTDAIGIPAAEAAARALLDARLAPIRELAAARNELKAAADNYALAYAASTAAGWSTDELTALDYEEPGKPTKRRSRATTGKARRGTGKRGQAAETAAVSVPEARSDNGQDSPATAAPATAAAVQQ